MGENYEDVCCPGLLRRWGVDIKMGVRLDATNEKKAITFLKPDPTSAGATGTIAPGEICAHEWANGQEHPKVRRANSTR